MTSDAGCRRRPLVIDLAAMAAIFMIGGWLLAQIALAPHLIALEGGRVVAVHLHD